MEASCLFVLCAVCLQLHLELQRFFSFSMRSFVDALVVDAINRTTIKLTFVKPTKHQSHVTLTTTTTKNQTLTFQVQDQNYCICRSIKMISSFDRRSKKKGMMTPLLLCTILLLSRSYCVQGFVPHRHHNHIQTSLSSLIISPFPQRRESNVASLALLMKNDDDDEASSQQKRKSGRSHHGAIEEINSIDDFISFIGRDNRLGVI